MSNLRQNYIPIQPTVEFGDHRVRYTELLPDLRLQSLIYCYWELKTTEPLKKQYNYKVVADGCIDIFFELEKPQENFVMGFCKKYTQFLLHNTFHYVGIRFFPAVFPQLFKIDASELSNRFEDLGNINPAISRFISGFQPGLSADSIKNAFDKYFLSVLAKGSIELDQRIANAIGLIVQNRGYLRVEKDLDTGLSPRQLRRLFNFYIGDTAKMFSKVVRFQKVLRSYQPGKKPRDLHFYQDDYYDQSHFIKDFKDFCGSTPRQLLRS